MSFVADGEVECVGCLHTDAGDIGERSEELVHRQVLLETRAVNIAEHPAGEVQRLGLEDDLESLRTGRVGDLPLLPSAVCEELHSEDALACARSAADDDDPPLTAVLGLLHTLPDFPVRGPLLAEKAPLMRPLNRLHQEIEQLGAGERAPGLAPRRCPGARPRADTLGDESCERVGLAGEEERAPQERGAEDPGVQQMCSIARGAFHVVQVGARGQFKRGGVARECAVEVEETVSVTLDLHARVKRRTTPDVDVLRQVRLAQAGPLLELDENRGVFPLPVATPQERVTAVVGQRHEQPDEDRAVFENRVAEDLRERGQRLLPRLHFGRMRRLARNRREGFDQQGDEGAGLDVVEKVGARSSERGWPGAVKPPIPGDRTTAPRLGTLSPSPPT